MEIKAYFKIIARFWWVIVLATLAAGGGSFVLSKTKQPVYSTAARIIVHPAPSIEDPKSVIDLVGQLGNRYIAGGYAQAFTSPAVRDEARTNAGLIVYPDNIPASDKLHDAASYGIEANVLPDTTVVQISGSGPDPETLAKYVNATVSSSISSTRSLFSVLELTVLEDAHVPINPISPQPSRDIPLGFGLGLAVGILLALALDYLLVPAAPKVEETTPEPEQGFMRPPLRRLGPN